MKEKIKNLSILITCCVILIIALVLMAIRATYFITKREAQAMIISSENYGPHEPYGITIRYFNSYLEKQVTCIAELKKSVAENFFKDNANSIAISYGKYFPLNVYLEKYNPPKVRELLFNIIIITIMLIVIRAIIRDLKVKKPDS